ncbi:helix-turn-helix domain-containing protein [uncultured Metabacillus sp.]|uniref:helix-turn-helix domain-containing protein n=1 Tax=uncultured Metabacillus sp. TaxID=2860135 RepID=UPI002622361D|nr:helix-turn-helix domain-containing protein [uncultured Metabacillus sp.]
MLKTKTFRKFLLSYVIILLFPLITGIVSYQVSINVAKSSSIESSLLILKKSKDILESRMKEVERFTRQLSSVEGFNQHLSASAESGPIDLYSLRETSRYLSTYAHTNDFLADSYIYLKNYNIILSNGSVFFRVDHFYELYHYHDLSFDQWKKTILEANHQGKIIPVRSYISNKKDLSVITYVQSLPLNSFNKPLGTAVINIDQQKIGGLLEGLSKQYGGWAFIADHEGNPLTMVGIDKTQTKKIVEKLKKEGGSTNQFLENETLLLSEKSDFNDWQYVAGIPKQGLMEKAEIIKHLTWIVTGSTLLIGILLCLFLAYRNSTPIHKLMDVVREQIGSDASKHKNEYDFIHGNISKLISNNKSLKSELTSQKQIIKDSFIKSLLNGEFPTQQGIMDRAEQLEVYFQGDVGYVGILKINGYGHMENKEIHDELNASRLIIKHTLTELEPTIKMTDFHSDKIIVIFSFNREKEGDAANEIKGIIDALTLSIANSYRISISAFIGRSFRNYFDISRSYHEAKEALDYTFPLMKGSKILWYQDVEKENSVFYYPIDLELRLVNAIKTAEAHDVKQILDQIFQKNFSERNLSPKIAEQLLEEIKSTLIKTFDSNVVQSSGQSGALIKKVLQIQLKVGIKQVWKDFKDLAEEFCSLVNKKKKETNDHAIKLIIEFLEKEYSDPDLSLYRISEKIGFPEKFVSQLFKEQLGEYVSDYLEKIRINKASELLVTTEQTIEEISVNVGYNSAHSFRRAFKRVLHVTPKVYRQTIIHSDGLINSKDKKQAHK